MKISTPEIKVIRFSSEDVIVASSSLTGKFGSFYIPSSQYSGYSTSSDLVEFNGTIGSKIGNNYLIENISGAKNAPTDEREAIMSASPASFMAVTVGYDTMRTMAQQYFDAFSYNGQYYTNGESYYDQYWNGQ